MEIKTKSTRMHSIIKLYDMHTQFFSNVIAGIKDEDALNRLNTKANHVAWLAGSLVQERFELAKLYGSELKQKADELFKDYKGIQDSVTYPPLAEFKKDWDVISPILRESFLTTDDAKLDSPFEMPEMKMSFYDLICFSIHREAYFIGQIGLWRRLLGYEAMKY